MSETKAFEICLSDENYSGILSLRLAAATDTLLPRFQTQPYTPGHFPQETPVLLTLEKFIRVAFSEIEVSEQLGQANRRLTFDLSVEITHALPLNEFGAWFDKYIRNVPLALEVVTNNETAYVFAPMVATYRHLSPADEISGNSYALDFILSKREAVNNAERKKYIADVQAQNGLVTVNLRPGVGSITAYGFSDSRNVKNATLFPENTFRLPPGTYYIFAKHKNGSFDYQRFTVQKTDEQKNYRISGRIIKANTPPPKYSISGRIEKRSNPTPIYRISGRIVKKDDGGGGGGGQVSPNAYGFPRLEHGVAYIDLAGTHSVPRLKIQVFENEGKYFIKDEAWQYDNSFDLQDYEPGRKYPDSPAWYVKFNNKFYRSTQEVPPNTPPTNAAYWQQVTVSKIYCIGLMSKNVRSSYYSPEQMRVGVDVTAWRGSEIVVYVMCLVDQDATFHTSIKNQQIYIPEPVYRSTEQLHGGTYYHKAPGQNFTQETRVHDFQDIIRLPNKPASHIVSVQTNNEAERLRRNQYAKSRVHSKYSDDITLATAFRGEDWLYFIGHPKAYNYTQAEWDAWFNNKMDTLGYAGFLTQLKAAFRREFLVNPDNGVPASNFNGNGLEVRKHNFVMYNNECHYEWNATFKDMVRQCFELFAAEADPAAQLCAWNARAIAYPSQRQNWQAAYQDYMQPDLAALKANATFFNVAPDNSYEWPLKIQQLGNYFNSPTYDHTIYHILAEAMMVRKFLPNYRGVATMFRLVENLDETGYLSQYFRRHQGKTYSTFEKPLASPHMLDTVATAATAAGGGADLWDDALSHDDNATAAYPPDNFDEAAQQWVELNGDPVHNIYPTTNVNAFVSGAWKTYQSDGYVDQALQLADVFHNGLWRTGAEVFPAGAYITGTPCVLYAKRPNGKLFIIGYDAHNKQERDIQIRIENNIHVLRLYADKIVPFVK